MYGPAFRALRADLADLAAALHVVGVAAAGGAECEDVRAVLRLLARHAESVCEAAERIEAESPNQG